MLKKEIKGNNAVICKYFVFKSVLIFRFYFNFAAATELLG